MKKRIFSAVMLLALCVVSVACGKKKVEKTPEETQVVINIPTATPQVTTDAAVQATTNAAVQATTNAAVQATDHVEDGISIYHGDDNAEYIIEDKIPKQEVTPELLLSELEKRGILKKNTRVNSLNVKKSKENGTTLALDFSKEFQDQLYQQGTAGEFIMMGSVVDTFLKAYEADSMTITVNGNILESGHCVYEGDMKFYEPDDSVSADKAAEAIAEALGAE